MKNYLHRILRGVLFLTIVNVQSVIGQSVDDLQEKLDNPVQTRVEGPEVVDLSNYDALDRQRPLYVRNGKSYKFINGTISRNKALADSAMLVISKGSSVELGESAILSGGNQYTEHELVLLETGSFKLSSGEIKDCYNPLIHPAIHFDYAVLVKTLNSSFEMTGGKLTHTNGVRTLGGPMTFTAGAMGNGMITSNTDFMLNGSVSVSDISLEGKAKILITSALKNKINIRPTPVSALKLSPAPPDDTGDYEGVIVATGKDYTLTENDVKMISSSRLSSSKWKFVLKNNNIVIRRVGEIVDAKTLQDYLNNSPAGTKDQPIRVEIPAEGIELECFIRTPENKHFLITGGSITVRDLQGGDGAFMVSDGSSLTFDKILLDGGTYKGNNFFFVRGTLQINNTVGLRNTAGYQHFYFTYDKGIANVYGGEVVGNEYGVQNYGTFNFYGGLFAECKYGIKNEKSGQLTITEGTITENCTYCIYSLADFRTKGHQGTNNIWIAKDVQIRITSAMNTGWVVQFIDDEFNSNTPIITGDGNTLKSEDVNKVKFILPQGYEAYLNAASNSIQIRATTNPSVINTEEKLRQAIQEATGTCNGEPTEIKITGEIPITTLFIKDKSIKLTGGTLKRRSNYTDGLFMLDNACLTLENIVIDGNKSSFTKPQAMIWPAFMLDNQAKLTINQGTEIRNHRVYNSHMGLIWITFNDKTKRTLVMNGGSIHDNEVPLATLITDNESKLLSFEMNGGSILQNATGYGIASANTFTMSGGTIENNTTDYFYNLCVHTGNIQTGSVIKEGQGGILVYSDLKLDGDGSCVADSITLYDPTARISRNGKQKAEQVLNHYPYNAGKLTAGTVVVAGTDGYQLTADDLSKFTYKNNAWKLELTGNTIILKENETQSFDNGDDLQDFLDGLGQSGNTGTEKDPIDIVFSDHVIKLSHPLRIPEATHVLFNGASFSRANTLKAATDSEGMLEVPENSSLSLINVTFDGANKEASEALLSVDGQLKIGSSCEIKGGLNKEGLKGAAVYISPTGTVTMSGGLISGNSGNQGSAVFNEGTFVLSGGSISDNTSEIGNIVNYNNSSFTMTGGIVRNNKIKQACGGIFIDENCQALFSGGEIYSNDHSDIYSWSTIKFKGNTKVSGSCLLIEPAQLLISSALQYNLKLDYLAETPVAGTIVSQGTDGYRLTAQDLSKISCPDTKWTYTLKNGNIILAERSATAIEKIESSQKVYVEDGCLILAGMQIGEPYFVYSINGQLVHTGKIISNRASYSLKESGIFIIKCGKKTFKVLHIE